LNDALGEAAALAEADADVLRESRQRPRGDRQGREETQHIRAESPHHSFPVGRPNRLAISCSKLSSTDFDEAGLFVSGAAGRGAGGVPGSADAAGSCGFSAAGAAFAGSPPMRSPGLIGRRNAASRRCAMSARLTSGASAGARGSTVGSGALSPGGATGGV